MDQTMTEQLMESTTPISYIASLFAVVSGLTVNEWGVIAGIIIGTATFAVNWWYKHKQDMRESNK